MMSPSFLAPPLAGPSRTIVRCLIGAVLLAAGALKVAQPAQFHADLLAYEINLPDQFLRLVAVAFPWLEVICGGALLANAWRETVPVLVAGLTLIFLVVLGQAVARGLDLRCGCFGAAAPRWLDHPLTALARAGLLCASSLWLLLGRAQDASESRVGS